MERGYVNRLKPCLVRPVRESDSKVTECGSHVKRFVTCFPTRLDFVHGSQGQRWVGKAVGRPNMLV